MDSKLWNIFTPGPILDTLGGHLDIGDIINLSRSCKGLAGLYQELVSRQWDVDRHLKRFVNKPTAFRKQLGLAGGLICGDFALQFFERRPLDVLEDCDVVMVQSNEVADLKNLLVGSEGYSLNEGEFRTPHAFKHIGKVLQLVRQKDYSVTRIRLFVIDSTSYRYAHPIRAIVEGCWTTSIVNFISYKTAYSIFPASTFLHRKSWLLEAPMIDGGYYPVQKYKDKGLKFETYVPAYASLERRGMRKCRKIADRMSWKIPLNIKDIDLPASLDPVDPDDVVSISESIASVEPEMQAYFNITGCVDVTESLIHHYNIKYLRYSGFFT